MKSYPQILLTILASGTALAVVLVGVLIGGYYYVVPSLPHAAELREIEIQTPLQIYSRDGRLLAEFGEMKRTPVAYADVPPLLIKAVLATEDEHFFEHPGIDYRGVVRGLLAELGIGPEVGGSTITQQVPRTLEVMKRAGLNSGFDRIVAKYKEMILAYRIEQEFTKEEILELYLNTSFFGQRSFGIATAAQTYFGKSLGELSVSETALLAGIPQRPTQWNPVYSTERARTRRSYVLRRMRETGAISVEQEQAALAEPIVGKEFGLQRQLEAPYVAEMARAEMVRRFGNAATTVGLKVTTTIDSRLQAAANRAMRENLTAYDERHGYRGPLAHVELPAAEPGATADAAQVDLAATEPAVAAGATEIDPVQLRALLEDHPTLLDYEPAIVLSADEVGARVFFAAHGVQEIDLTAVEWAAPFVHDDLTGPTPTTVAEVLHAGDVVRFRRTAEGGWRLAQIPEVQGAFASIDPFDGAVVALNGGFDFFLSNFNRATQAERQPGSSFKPFVYSAALENGFTTATVVPDAPPDIGYQAALERVWRPENFGGKYYGPSRLREALRNSMNAVSIRILQTMGVPRAVEHVKRFGFDDVAVPENLSLALGAGGVAPLDLAAGYAAFANGGFKVTPYFIDRVTMHDGTLLYVAEPLICAECYTPPETEVPLEPETPELVAGVTELYPAQRAAPRAISPQNAYLIADMLEDVVRRGTGNQARVQLARDDLAGKTGTTNEGRDTWFVGFNTNIVGAAWVGFDLDDRPLGQSEQGSRTALPMWVGFMREALAGTPEHRRLRPPGIVEYRINPITGLIASDGTPNSIFEKFDIDNLPEREHGSGFVPSEGVDPGAEPRPSTQVEQQIFN
jgi:penicillin-binding protein 1A